MIPALQEAIRQMFLSDVGLLVEEGSRNYLYAMIIVFALFGMDMLFHYSEEAFWGRLVKLVVFLTLGECLLLSYQRPWIGGQTFPQVITNWTAHIAQMFVGDTANILVNRLSVLSNSFEIPSWTNPGAILVYYLLMLQIWFLEILALVVVGYSMVGQTVAALLLPEVFFTFILPGLDWIWWGFLKCWVQYAFMGVVAAVEINIFARLIVKSFDALPIFFSVGQQAEYFVVLAGIMSLASYSILKVPTLTNHLFSGSAGGHFLDRWI